MRVRFRDVFHVHPDGSVAPRMPVVVGGVQLAPGVEFGRRVRIGSVHFAAVAGRDLEVEANAGTLFLLRTYVPPPDRRAPPPPPSPSSVLVEALV